MSWPLDYNSGKHFISAVAVAEQHARTIPEVVVVFVDLNMGFELENYSSVAAAVVVVHGTAVVAVTAGFLVEMLCSHY